MSAIELGRAMAAGKLDPVEVAEAGLEAIRASADQAIFLRLTAERALAEAARSRRRLKEGRPRSPLEGVPIAWKDLFDLKDTPTTAGSRLFAEAPPRGADAPSVAHLSEAGMVCLGKTNLNEFAFSALGYNPHFGTPRNPNDRAVARSPGGSSSGSAVAVAAGLLPCAIGSDTGGSVRIPAAFNGIFGHHSSHGRISLQGVFPLSPSFDTAGPLARSLGDCRLLDALLRGLRVDPRAEPPALDRLSLLVLDSPKLSGVSEPVRANLEGLVEAFARGGARISRAAFPPFDAIVDLIASQGSLAAAEAAEVHRERMTGAEAGAIDPRVLWRLERGAAIGPEGRASLEAARAVLKREAGARMADFDLLLLPTSPFTAPELAPLVAEQARFQEVNSRALSLTAPFNFLGFCGLAVPSGRDHRGLPTSALLAAAGGRDDELLAWGLTIEPLIRARVEIGAPC